MTLASTRRFGLELQKQLNSRSFMEADLVRAMTAIGNGISRQYVNMIMHNTRTPPPELIERFGDALKLSRDDRTILHRAAALDVGYRIGAVRQ
jgi:hypothetical protein